MDLDEIRKVLKDHKPLLEHKYHVSTLGIFGSYVRNEQAEDSDLDILVEFAAPIDMFEFITLEQELSELLSARVDLVSRNALKPYIGKRILSEVLMV